VKPSRNANPWAARTLAACAATCAGLLAAELAVERWCAVPAALFRADPVLLHSLRPHARRVLARPAAAGGGRVATEINAHGMRGPELAADGAAARVVVYGDSLVLAETTEIERTFVERLGAHLRAQGGAEVEMVNAGVTGYGPDQACLRMEGELGALAPRLVVLVLCAHNDMGDLVRNKLFRLDAAGRAVENRPRLAPELRAEFEARARDTQRPALVRWFESAFAGGPSPGAIAPPDPIGAYLAAAAAEHAQFVLAGDDVVRSLFEDYYDADVALGAATAAVGFKRALLRAVLQRCAAACARLEVGLLAVVVPSAVDVVPDFEVRVDRARHPGYAPQRLSGVYVELLAELGIAHVDLFAPFVAAGPRAAFDGTRDFHWSAGGQELGARACAERVLYGVSHFPAGSATPPAGK
jgi:hypothetical protein